MTWYLTLSVSSYSRDAQRKYLWVCMNKTWWCKNYCTYSSLTLMNILIIEDDRFFAEHLCRVFQGNKLVHRVDRVESFEEFLIVFSVLE